MSVILFHCPSMNDLAYAISRPPRITLGSIAWKKFEDGFPNLMIEDVESAVGKDVVFLASFDTPDEIFRQLAVIHALPRYGVRSLTIMLPYFPTGTMERVEEEGEIATAMTLARLLSATPLSSGRGPARLVIYDIHALPERFYFGDNVIPVLRSGIPLLREALAASGGPENISIVFPDTGAHKRFGKRFPEYPHVICRKTRLGDARDVKIVEGSARGRYAVIVDDLTKTCGTLIECKAALERDGAESVASYVTHAVCPGESAEKLLAAGFDRIWITDSCPNTAWALHGRDSVTILSLANPIAEFIAPEKGINV